MASWRGVREAARRAVDECGMKIDVRLQKQRDKAAAKRFFRRILRSPAVPRKIVFDQLRSYPAAKAAAPELTGMKHVFVRACARVNNRTENSRRPTRRRKRHMQGFRDALPMPSHDRCSSSCLFEATNRRLVLLGRYRLHRHLLIISRNPVHI